MEKGKDETKVVPIGPPAEGELPYTVELWDLPRNAAERVIGRASSAILARAIFTAALREHLGRRIVLRRGQQIMAESG
jgi:hypothetical protein